MTLQQRLAQTGGRPSGFDYLRLGLALCVIVFHTAVICYGQAVESALLVGPFGAFCALPVPMFFAISGYLVADSLSRAPSLIAFLAFRALRIFPALAAVTLFSALAIGPAFTALALPAYFHDSGFRSFFLNVPGIVQYYLPGVFLDHPIAKVNGQLWTIPFELRCYMVLVLLALVSVQRHRWLLALCVVFCSVLLLGRQNVMHVEIGPPGLNGSLQILCFLSGTSLWLFRGRIVLKGRLFLLCASLALLCLALRPLAFLSALPIAYCTVFLGMLDPARIGLVRSGDYSYGLYLVGYPVQQAVVSLVPAAHGNGILNLAIAIPAAFLLAALSWHFVEKPALRLKGFFRTVGSRADFPVPGRQTP